MAKKIQIVDRHSAKVDEQTITEVAASISPPPGDTVRIFQSRSHVAGYERDGLDLVITFDDGTTLRIESYFNCPVEARSEIIFGDQDTGEAWRAVPDEAACYPVADGGTSPTSFHYEPVTVANNDTGMGWLLPAVLLASGAGIAAAAAMAGGGHNNPPPPPPGDTAAPDAPVLNASNGTVISGTAEPESTVKIDINGDGQSDMTATADAQGNWSVTPDTPVPSGTKVTATATDGAGNTSVSAQTIVDGTPPNAPVVNPSNGTTITGTAEPGSTIGVDVDGDGNPDYTTVAGLGGSWSVTPNAPLADGTTVTVVSTDPAGNSSAPTQTVVDATAPAAPVVNPTDGTTIAGTAEPGSTVGVDVDGDGTPDYTTVAAPDGRWSITPDAPIADGTTIAVVATDPTGNSSTPTQTTIDATPPTAPVVNPTDGTTISGTAEPGSTVGVDVDGDGTPDYTTVAGPDGSWSVTPDAPIPNGTVVDVVATDPTGNSSAPTQTTIDATPPAAPVVNPTDGTTISGTAEPGSTVGVDVDGDGTPDYTTIVAPDGSWSITPDAPIADGTTVDVVATDPAGNSSAPTQTTIDATPPTAPVVSPTDGTIIAGTAEPGSTIGVDIDGDGTPDYTTVAAPDGSWLITPDAPIPDGTVVDVVATDPAGNSSTPTQTTIDATPPTAPVVNPTDGTTISGTAEPGSTIGVDVDGDGTPDYTTVAAPDGSWSITPSAPVADGTTIDVVATDPTGNSSAPAQTVVDATPPTAPVVNPTDGTTIGGTAEPGSTVGVDVDGDGTPDYTTIVAPDGSWSITPDVPIADGTTVSVVATDPTGNSSVPTQTTIDATPPAAPVVNPTDGTTISGTAEPGSTIGVDVDGDGTPDYTTVAAPDGSWSITPGAPIADGTTIDVVATDPTGNSSTPTQTVIDATPPAAPVVNPTDGTTISGTAEPGSTVGVDVDGDGTPDYTTVAAPDGSWSITPSAPVADGTTIDVVATDPTGNSSTPTQTAVDATAPLIAINGPVEADNIVNASEAADGVTITGTTDAQDGQVVTVTFTQGGNTVTETATATGGAWSVSLAPAQLVTLGDGPVAVTASVADIVGNSAIPATTSFTVDTAGPTAPVTGDVTDNVGTITGPVAANGITDDSTPVIDGSGAEPGATVNIYDGATQIGTTTADPSGNWSFTPSAPFTDGTYSISSSVTDAAGNEGPMSNTVGFTVDTIVPAVAPSIDGITDDVAPVVGNITSGSTTNDNLPALSGAGAEPNSTVNVYDNGTLIGTASADATGAWSFTPGTPLPDGTHDLTVSNVDAAGNEGPSSAPYSIIVDAVPPTALPVITEVQDDMGPTTGLVAPGGVTNDPNPSVNGTLDTPIAANEALHVFDAVTGVDLGLAIVTGTTWTFQDPRTVNDGDVVRYTAQVIDAAGGTGPVSNAYEINIVITPPTQVATLTAITDDTGAATNDFITSDQTLTLSGTLSAAIGPDKLLKVFDENGGELGTATVTGLNWTFDDSGRTQTEGNHSYQLRVDDTAGNQGPVNNQDITIDLTAPTTAATISNVIDDTGAVTGVIVSGGTTDDTNPVVHGTIAAPLQAGETVHLYDGVTDLGTATVVGTNWTFADGRTLTDGQTASYIAHVVDAAGNGGPASAAYTITIDLSAPTTAPAIGSITDDVAPVIGTVADGDTTNDARPTLNGTGAEPDSSVNVYDNGTPIGTAVADGTGAWSFTPTTDLVDGPHAFTVSSVDAAGNEGPQSATPFDIIVSTVAPVGAPVIESVTDDAAPVIGTVANGGFTNDATPLIAGSGADANATVNVYDNGTLIGTTTADGTGAWSYSATALTTGSHSFTVSNVDGAGNEGPQSIGYTVIFDATAPLTAPAITDVTDDAAPMTGVVANGGTTNDTHPAISGTGAEPNSTVNVYDNGTLIGSTTASGTGTWSFTPTTGLIDGAHALTVSSVDGAGNEGPQSATSYDVTVDTAVPTAIPVIGGVADDVAPVTGPVADGGTTNDDQPTISGTGAEPDAMVNIYDNGVVIGTIVADATGAWSFTPTTPLANGSHSLTTSSVDAAGNEGPQSAAYAITVDTVAPVTAPVIDGILDDVAPVTGTIADGGTTNDARPTLPGSGAEPNGTVNIYDNGVLIGTTVADATGAWSFTPATGLTDGAHAFTVSSVDAAGNEGPQSATPYDIIIDTGVPSTPSFAELTDDVGTITGPIVSGDVTDDTQPTFAGSAEPDSTVNIYDNGTLIASVSSDATGAWSFIPASALTQGAHSFTATVVDAAGNESTPTTAINFTLDTTAPTTVPTIGSVTDDVAPAIGTVADGGTTNDARPTLDGTGAEPNSTVNVYDNGTLLGKATADNTGAWSFTPAIVLADGAHSFIVSSVDAAGNEGPQSAAYDMTVDTAAPAAAPSIDTIDDNVAPVLGNVSDGAITNDTTPSLSGTGAEPDATVNVYDNGALIGTTVADNTGVWSFTPATGLADGAHSFTVSSLDAAGNEGPQSTPYAITVDTQIPAGLVAIDSIDNDTGAGGDFITSDTTLMAFGHLSAPLAVGETLQVSIDNGANWLDVTPTGTNWSYADARTLSDGTHDYQARILSASGIGGTVTTQTVTVDTAAPATIAITSITDDTGTAGDFITSDTALTVNGTLSAALDPGEKAQISIDGGTTWLDLAPTGTNWGYADGRTLGDGTYDYQVRTIDTAGNSTAVATQTVTVDTTAPGIIAIDAISADTGDLSTDFLTTDTTLTLSGHLGAALGAGETAQISVDNGASWIDLTTVAGTSWSYVDGRTLTDDLYNYQVRIIDAAGNAGLVASQTVTVDTTLPNMLTGIEIVDSIDPTRGDIADGTTTNDSSPEIRGTGAEPNSLVNIYNGDAGSEVLIGTTRADGAGNWSFIPSAPLADNPVVGDPYAWSVSNVDAAGMEGPLSAPLHFRVDTQNPADSTIDAIAVDTGASTTDFVTNDSNITLSGHFNQALTGADTARISFDGGANWELVTVDGPGLTWTYTPSAPLADGTYFYEVVVTDAADNVGQSDTQKIVIDTTAPDAISIGGIDVDSGVSSVDFITSDSSIVLNGTLAAPLAIDEHAETAQISLDGGATWTDLVVTGTSWSYVDARTLADGPINYQVRIVDLAGNISPIVVQTVIIDTAAPAAPTITAITDDTGISGDFTTSDTTLTITGTLSAVLDAGDRAQISIDGGATWTDVSVVGTDWSYVDGRTLADGSYSYQIRTIDLAGNIQTGAAQTITVDTTAPTQSILIDSIATDTGASASDFLTSDTMPTVAGHLSAALGAGQAAEISLDGGATWAALTVVGTGWSYAIASPLAEGDTTISVRVSDLSGNAGPVDSQIVTVDTAAPTETASIVTYTDNVGGGTGNFASGTSTDDTSPVLNGTLSGPAEVGDVVHIYAGATLIGTVALNAGDTSWSFSGLTGLTDGTYDYTARLADAAGNESAADAPFTIIVDALPPVVTSLAISNIDTDTWYNSAVSNVEDIDLRTRDTHLTVSGTANISADGILQISSDGGTTWNNVPVTGTSWTYIDPTERTSNVTYQLRVVDASGNVASTTTSRLVIIDVAEPVAGVLAPVLVAADDTGTVGDNVTTDQNVVFSSAQSGLKEAGATIQLIEDVNNNGIYEQGIDRLLGSDTGAGTAWSISRALDPNRTMHIGFVQYDTAGNYSRLSPTTAISHVNGDSFAVGGFNGTGEVGSVVSYASGMSVGIDQTGRLQFTSRDNVFTQTSQTAGTTQNPATVSGEVIANNTFFDYNRDGNIDYATSSNDFGANAQTIYTGQANGTHVGYRQNIATSGYSSALGGVVAFDKDGDGYLDLIWGDWGDDNPTLSTVVNNSGTLAAGNILDVGIAITPDKEVSGVDIDNDGDIDLAMHSYRVNGVTSPYALTILGNDGSGVYSLTQSTADVFNNINDESSWSVSMTWADFDGDGDLDLYLNRTTGSNVSGIFTNDGGTISGTKIAIGDTATPLDGGASLAIDWNHDGKMDVVEFANSASSGPIQLYLNTGGGGAISFGGAPISLATGQAYIGGVSAVDYDWDGDVDIVYQTANNGTIKSIANTNQVQDGTALHLRIVDQNGVNSYYGNTVQLFDSEGNLVATQVINAQSGIGANDSTGILNFYGLSATETYTAVLIRTVNGVSQDIGGVSGLTNGAATLSTIENVNASWTDLAPGASNGAYILSGESGVAVNDGSFAGTGYNDTFFGSEGDDSFAGGGGWSLGLTSASTWSATGGMDVVDYGASAGGITANLATGTATGQGNDSFSNIEGIRGGSGADSFTDSAADNLFEGRGGNDTITLNAGGHDVLVYRMLDASDATGGNGADTIVSFTAGKFASTGSADILDMRDLLRNYTGTANIYIDASTGQNVLDYASSGLKDYLHVEISGADTLIQVDINGTGTFTTIATLSGVNTTLADLLANNQLWVASNDTGVASYNVAVTPETTADTTPIITGSLPFALDNGAELKVVVNGVTYSSANPDQVVVDPLNHSWYLQLPTALAAGTYNVTAAVFNGNGAIVMQDVSTNELVIAPPPSVSFGGSGGASNKATALTIGEDGAWRIFSNDTVYDSSGTNSATLGNYSAQSITVSGQNTQNATFMDYNRDGYIDIMGIDQDYAGGQQSWTFNGSSYAPFQVSGSGVTSANVWSWFGGVMAYDKDGDGYADLVYGDNTPDDAEAPGGYDTSFVVNNAGTFIKDGNYVFSNTGTPAPTSINNASPDKELSGVDLNNDGAVDVVYHATNDSNTTGSTTSSNLSRLVVVTNSGNAALTNTQILDNIFVNEESLTSYVPSMTWADFNGDGTMDLFLARGATNGAGTVTTSEISRIYYNDAGTLVSSTSGTFATSYLGDSLAGGTSFAVDWNADGRMDAIELPRYDVGPASQINLYTNGGGGAFATSSLATLPTNANVTGGVMLDLDWDGDRDLVYFRASGSTGYVQNDAVVADGTSLHLRILDSSGINALFGNTVQLFDSAGNLVASQIINPQSGNQTNDSSAIVDFFGLDPNDTYSAVLLRNVGGLSQDVGGLAMAGANAIENVNAAWSGLTPAEADHAYVLTAEAGNNFGSAPGVGVVGTGYNDTLFATMGDHVYNGGGGTHDGAWSNTGGEDVLDFKLALSGVTVDLGLTTAQNTGWGTVTLHNIEGISGSQYIDTLTGNGADNMFEGRGGNDLIHLESGGRDTILLQLLDAADATGGNGMDTVTGFKIGTYEGTPGADRIDLKDLLSGYTGDSDGAAHYVNGVATLDAGDAIGDFLKVTTSGSDTIISIDRDGLGGTYAFTDVVTLSNVHTDLQTLLANHQLVTA